MNSSFYDLLPILTAERRLSLLCSAWSSSPDHALMLLNLVLRFSDSKHYPRPPHSLKRSSPCLETSCQQTLWKFHKFDPLCSIQIARTRSVSCIFARLLFQNANPDVRAVYRLHFSSDPFKFRHTEWQTDRLISTFIYCNQLVLSGYVPLQKTLRMSCKKYKQNS